MAKVKDLVNATGCLKLGYPIEPAMDACMQYVSCLVDIDGIRHG